MAFPCFFFLLMTLMFTGCPGRKDNLTPEDITTNNHGVGLMGRFAYDDAREVFSRLAQHHPEWLEVKVNLAIAILNRQQEGDDDAALAILQEVLARDNNNLRAHYCRGLLLSHLGRLEEALTHFRFVVETDPTDAYAAYFLAQGLMQQGGVEEALHWYQRAVELDPYLRSAYYGAFQAAQRAGQVGEARAMLENFQRLQGNPRAHTAELKYTRMGPKAEAFAMDLPGAGPTHLSPAQGAVFKAQRLLIDPSAALRWTGNERRKNITVADINGDGQLDLFIANAFPPSAGRRNAVLLSASRGEAFAVAVDHPFATLSQVNTAAWGDFDNDGLTDVYFCRQGPNQLWRQHDGTWTNVANETQTAGGDFDTRDCLFVDADHDGDLDIFVVNADGPNELFNNNGDGSFRSLAAEQGISGDGRPSRAVLVTDLDGDRDADLIVIHTEPPHEVYLNDRLWSYHAADGFENFRTAAIIAAVAADVDVDGRPEIYTLTPKGALQCWRPDRSGTWRATTLLPESTAAPLETAQLAILDVTGDGNPEVIVSTSQGWSTYALTEGQKIPLFDARPAHETSCEAWTPVVFSSDSGPSIVGVCGDAGPSVWDPGPGRQQFASLTFSGRHDAGQVTRSNASGIGVYAAIRVDSHWTGIDTFRNFSGPGQSLQPTAVGVGDAGRIDFASIDWSDGVFQSELDLAAGSHHRIIETQRQLSSCPLLFAWDGTKFAFVSDILGVGGLGYAVGPRQYAPPRPWENFLLPQDLLHTKDNRYQLKLVQSMEEVCYLDAARLVVYDLPPGWDMALDERMGVNEPKPSGSPLFFRRELLPTEARDERGVDVTELVTSADRRAAPLTALDLRFIGRLREEHAMTLRFPTSLDAIQGQPVLLADGWIEYPYSQTMFAAWQAGAEYHAPTIEARKPDGEWVVVYEQFGYPAGMPRRMALPLTRLPLGVSEIRIRTNQEIYWDRLAIAYAEPAPQVKRTILTLHEAKLTTVGFPKRMTGAQRVPGYDYDQRQPFWDTRHMAGFYTAIGPATELVQQSDDALAIFGPGEEAHLEFIGLDQPPPTGWTRRFVLEATGWAKDMDLYTKDGDTVEPLPAIGGETKTRDRLHARYNTRYEAGH